MTQTQKLDKLFKTSIKKKDLALFQQGLMLNDTLNLFPPQYLQGLVLKLFKAKTAPGWKVALAFNGALDLSAKVPESTLTSMYKPLVGKMSWNSTPDHLKEMWWKEIGTRVTTVIAKSNKKSVRELLPVVSSTGIVLDWSSYMITERNGVEVDRKTIPMVWEVFYENGRLEAVCKELKVGRGNATMTLDDTASFIAKEMYKTYKIFF